MNADFTHATRLAPMRPDGESDQRKVGAAALLCLPSFYGGTAWIVWLMLYLLRLILWDHPSGLSLLVFSTVALAYIVSTLVFLPLYQNSLPLLRRQVTADEVETRLPAVLIVLHTLGFLGIAKYLLDSVAVFGGLGGLFGTLLHASYLLRYHNNYESNGSIAFQLTYFGWAAIALTVFLRYRRPVPRWMLLAAMVQFAGNLLFIDRTRPIWILVTSALIVLPLALHRVSGRVLRNMVLMLLAVVGVFIGVQYWSGKVVYNNLYDPTVVPESLQPIYVYGTSGFAYFDYMLNQVDPPHVFSPIQTTYPLVKALATVGIAPPPPSQVQEFYYVPFPTNVGTFLQPFFEDGGYVYLAFGILLYSFGFNLLGLWFLRRAHPLALYAWANICFAVGIGFFTPKIGETAFWLFLLLGSMLPLLLARSSVAETGIMTLRGGRARDVEPGLHLGDPAR